MKDLIKTQNKCDIQNIVKRAFKNIYETSSEEQLSIYLRAWWCNYYKRPTKDPLLKEYTFEELLVEYYEQSLLNNSEEYKKMEAFWIRENDVGDMTDDEWVEKQEEEQIKKIESGEIKGLGFNDKF